MSKTIAIIVAIVAIAIASNHFGWGNDEIKTERAVAADKAAAPKDAAKLKEQHRIEDLSIKQK